MEIEWKSNLNASPYLFIQQAAWNGIKIHRAKVLPGRLLESADDFHKINISISGNLTTEKSSACGNKIITKGSAGNMCITPSGQTMGAVWNKTLDNLGILLEPDFVVQTAVENCFSGNFEFAEIYRNQDALV